MSSEERRITPEMLNLSQLMTLALVARHGSYTRAAEVLGISQPSVSQQIKELERACGIPLVLLRGRSLALTPLGQELAAFGERLALERERAARAVERHRSGSGGYVAVAASMTTGTYLLPKMVAKFLDAHPGVRVDVRVGNSGEIVKLILDDVADVGVIEGPVFEEGVLVTPFSDDVLVCVCGPKHRFASARRVQPGEFATETLLVREPGSGSRDVVLSELERSKMQFGRIALFGTNETIKAAVAAGLGIAWVPEISIAQEAERGQLRIVTVEGVHIARQFAIVRRRDTAPSPAARKFIEQLTRPAR